MSIRLERIAEVQRRDPPHGSSISPALGGFEAFAVERASEGQHGLCIQLGGAERTRLETLRPLFLRRVMSWAI